MSNQPVYPFAPKSTAKLLPGQFWALPLSNGLFGCGRVIQLASSAMPGARVTFLAGALDCVSTLPPSYEAISGAKCIAQGQAHVKAITETGGEIIGCRPLALDGIIPSFFRGASYWKNSFVHEGCIPIRPQLPQDENLPVLSTWGYKIPVNIAEARFVINNVEVESYL